MHQSLADEAGTYESPPSPREPARTLVVRCLGQFGMLSPDGWQSGPPLKKGRELLAYLVTHQRTVAAKDKLIEAFWPSSDGSEGTHRVHLAVSGARTALKTVLPGFDAIRSVGGGYAWNPALHVASDVEEFLACANAATLSSCLTGVELYRGDFLAGNRGDWIEPIRIRCSSNYLEMLLRLADDELARGEHRRAVEYGLRIMESDPGHEAGARTLMRAFAAVGRRSAALIHYDGLRAYLQRHIGVQPSEETTRLWHDIRVGLEPSRAGGAARQGSAR